MFVAVPTFVLIAAALGHAVPIAGWSAAAIWVFVLPQAHGEAFVVPIVMIVLCLAIAIGPERLGRLFEDRREPPNVDAGWIEEA